MDNKNIWMSSKGTNTFLFDTITRPEDLLETDENGIIVGFKDVKNKKVPDILLLPVCVTICAQLLNRVRKLEQKILDFEAINENTHNKEDQKK